jgi:hypothetical protein
MKTLFLLCLLLVSVVPQVSARTISWFNAPGDVMVDSANNLLGTSIAFEVGTFGSFVPTTGNLDLWASNWTVFDRAVSGDGWSTSTGFLTSSAQFRADGTSSYGGLDTFSMGDVIYLWAYDSQAFLPTSQWALVRDASNGAGSLSWTLPASDISNPTSIDWDLVQADTAVIGAVNGMYGGGDFHTQADPGFMLQLAAVPEPGSAALLIAAMWFSRFRRRNPQDSRFFVG